LVLGACFVAASLWFAAVDWPSVFRPVGFLVLAVLSLAYWRHLLPNARHISNIQRTLYGEEKQ
jgi:membrane protein implicated in regulation of membrane protease activity